MIYTVDFSKLSVYIDLAVIVIIGVVLYLFTRLLTKNKFICFLFCGFFILNIIFYIFEINVGLLILMLVEIPLITTIFVIHTSDIIKLFGRGNSKAYNQLTSESKEGFYKIIEDAVIALSKTQTGALITFEKGENLDMFINTGKKIDAPVSSELLRTIFYLGTPLHDGAVIIRGNMIEAASCFYTPTTKAMEGKVGARHRAALGFSETHSSITVVVSEETGRISFAVNGEIISVSHEQFKSRLMELLED